MNTALASLLLLSSIVAIGQTEGIKIFPYSAAADLRECASYSGWFAANIRWGYYSDANNDDRDIQHYLRGFKEKMDGIVSTNVADKIRHMFGYAGWCAANTRVGYYDDARRDEETVNRLHDEIISSGELSSTLVGSLRAMGWDAAWHSANTRIGYHDDADRDAQSFYENFDRTHGTVRLVDVNFLSDLFHTVHIEPFALCECTINNCQSSIVQSKTCCSGSESVGETATFTHTVGFEYSITFGITAGVSFISGELSYEAQFGFSESFSLEQSLEHTKTRDYSYPLSAPPGTITSGHATSHKANGDVPYQLTFDFGGVEKTITGLWAGIVKTKSVYTIEEDACSN